MITRPGQTADREDIEIEILWKRYLKISQLLDPPIQECDCLPFDLFRMSCFHNLEHGFIRHLTDEELETGEIKVAAVEGE